MLVWMKALFRYCDILCWREVAMTYCCQKSSCFCWCCLSRWNVPSRECALLSFCLFRKDHLSSPPVPYEELQKLMEAVLKRCADLSPPQSSKRHAVSQKLLLVGRTKQNRNDPPSTLCGWCIHVLSPSLWLLGFLVFLLILVPQDGISLYL